MSSLLSILKDFGKKHLKDLEKEQLFSTDDRTGLSPTERWELNKLEDKPQTFTEFSKEFTITKTYKLDE